MANRVKGGKVKPKSEGHHNELLENPEAIREKFSQTESFFKSHTKLVLIVGGIVAVAIAGVFGFKYYESKQNQTAQVEMFQAVYYFETDSLDKALNGDGNNYGFLEIIDNYSFTDAANLASYYAGVTYLKKGDYQNAIDYLNDFGADDELVQARAYSLIGDANMQLERYQEAIDYYQKAADYNPNEFFSPQYLMKAAIAYEATENYQGALQMYDRIIDEFPQSAEFQDAQKEKMRVQGLTAQ